MLTAVGKRVQLVRCLKKDFFVVGTDCSSLAPASGFCDLFYIVPQCNDKDYLNQIIELCQKYKIDVLLPLFEPEFVLLDSIRLKLQEIGTFLMLSHKNALEICNDKWKTYNFFVYNNIKAPKSVISIKDTENLIENTENLVFPLFIKPRVGMGSVHTYKVNDIEELNFYSKNIKNPIIQEFIEGTEYTIDCICDQNERVVSIVPRERIEVKSGEVSKSRTWMDESLIDISKIICEKLKCIGPITIQCIKYATKDSGIYSTKDREAGFYFTEINSRIGGGVPLSIEAGVEYGKFFSLMALNQDILPTIGQFKELTMLRYDDAVFL